MQYANVMMPCLLVQNIGILFASDHALLHKISDVCTLCTKAEIHSSVTASRTHKFNHVLNALGLNGYLCIITTTETHSLQPCLEVNYCAPLHEIF